MQLFARVNGLSNQRAEEERQRGIEQYEQRTIGKTCRTLLSQGSEEGFDQASCQQFGTVSLSVDRFRPAVGIVRKASGSSRG